MSAPFGRRRHNTSAPQRVGLLAAITLLLTLAQPVVARPCGTMATEAFARQGNAATFAIADRPEDANLFIDGLTHPVRVHYPSEALEPRAQEALIILEAAYASQVIEQGFSAPLADDGRGGNDAFDLYLTFFGPVGGRTLADDDVSDSDGRHAAPAHVQVDPTVDELDAFIVHEFNHVLQYSTDASASLMFFEASAVYQEILGAPDTSGWRANVMDHQQRPEIGPHVDGVKWATVTTDPALFDYGAGLFIAYLDETYGDGDGRFVAQLWNESVQADDVTENEPDWADAFSAATDVSLSDAVLDYATWRAFVGPKAQAGVGPSFGANLSGAELLRTQTVSGELNGQNERTIPFFSEHGCLPFELSAPTSGPIELLVHAEDQSESPRALGLSVTTLGPGAQRSVMGGDGPVLDAVVTIAAGARDIVAFCDIGELDVDAQPTKRTIRYVLRDLARFPLPDAGPAETDAGVEPEPTPEPPPVCSCQSAALPEGGPFGRAKELLFPLMLLGGLASIIIRARRAKRRKQSYRGTDWKADAGPRGEA